MIENMIEKYICKIIISMITNKNIHYTFKYNNFII